MAYVLDLQTIDHTRRAAVGGKGALLGELSRLDGIRVPPGFCVTTDAFREALAQAPSLHRPLAALADTDPDDRRAIRALSAEVRRAVEAVTIPEAVVSAITQALPKIAAVDSRAASDARAPVDARAPAGVPATYAVRSSATAEDLPAASFAGQHDSHLDVTGPEGVLDRVRRCWASLFTERAVSYRLHNGIDHRAVQMAVVVQRMIDPRAAGVLFTADPVTGNRMVAVVEATPGVGEALVGGQVNGDAYTVRGGEVTERTIAAPEAMTEPALTDAEAVTLVGIGRRIEARLGGPQDIEWCLDDGGFWIVQSRPITTLFPIPEDAGGGNRVYLSVGHQQMMTEAMRPLGISVWQLTAMAPMHEAGGRPFVDVTERLASPATRKGLLELIGRGDPLTRDALETLIERRDFLPAAPEQSPPAAGGPATAAAPAEIATDPAIVAGLIERDQASAAALRREIETRSGPALFTFLRDAFEKHKRGLRDPLSMQAIMAGMRATWWLNEQLETWLGERNAADALTLAAPGNVTSEMGLELLDVADVIRPHRDVVSFLARVAREGREDAGFVAELTTLPGGREAQGAIDGYLERYGMRCVGEIDITQPRFGERPATLVGPILANVRNFAPGEARRRVQAGLRTARDRERELLTRLRDLPDGADRALQAKRMIDRVRTFSGYREYPKYGIVTRYFLYKRALLGEARRLVADGVLADAHDSFYLTFDELEDAVRTGRADRALVRRRREAFAHFQMLTPPRVLTSDGEGLSGSYRRGDVPAGALVGLAVSSGTVEGRARVVADIAHADIEPGDVLVTTYTDPSWTPVFLAAGGLVTEVGGLMTHGAVIAREYGVPAVVGVHDATRLIADGQRIRVHGADGYVELLTAPPDRR